MRQNERTISDNEERTTQNEMDVQCPNAKHVCEHDNERLEIVSKVRIIGLEPKL